MATERIKRVYLEAQNSQFTKKNGAWVSSVSFGGKILVDFLNPNIAVFYRIYMVLKPYGKRFVFHSGYAAVC